MSDILRVPGSMHKNIPCTHLVEEGFRIKRSNNIPIPVTIDRYILIPPSGCIPCFSINIEPDPDYEEALEYLDKFLAGEVE
jgi:hypothetical protein